MNTTDWNLNSSNMVENLQIIPVVRVTEHPDWTGDKRRGHDIALLRLEYLSVTTPIPFPTSKIKIEKGEALSILSSGRSSQSASHSSELQLVRVGFIRNRDCKEYGTLMGFIQPGMMCLGGKGSGICTGEMLNK